VLMRVYMSVVRHQFGVLIRNTHVVCSMIIFRATSSFRSIDGSPCPIDSSSSASHSSESARTLKSEGVFVSAFRLVVHRERVIVRVVYQPFLALIYLHADCRRQKLELCMGFIYMSLKNTKISLDNPVLLNFF